MIYALVTGGVVENTIVVDDVDFLAHIAGTCDSAVRIDTLDPMPAIGWNYDGSTFTDPNAEE